MNFDSYLKNFSGHGISVTVIDTGVMLERENIAHFRYDNGCIIACDAEGFRDLSETYSSHGTDCVEVILRVAPNVSINDICVEENSLITESALISALRFAHSDLESDIVCVCLALDEYSSELLDALKEMEGTFIVASGSKDKVLYPADLDNVIKVYYNSEISGVRIISENTIAVNHLGENYNSSSMSCAYFTGLFSLVLEEKALWKHSDVRTWLFQSINPSTEKPIHLQAILDLPEKFVAVFPSKYLNYRDSFIDNLVGYYDDEVMLHSFDGISLKENENKTLYINEDERQKVITPTTIGNFFAGNFINATTDNKIQLLNHYKIKGDYICEIEQPIIALASFGYGASKFDLQLKLHSGITKLGYSAKSSTHNPMGILFKDFMTFEYPKTIICPKIIYSLNKVIYETSLAHNPDIFILNVGGSIRAINYHNPYDMGMLFEAYMKAFRIDVVFLCANTNVSVDTLLFEIQRLKATGIAEVVVVASNKQYDSATLESGTGLKHIQSSDDKQKTFIEVLRSEYDTNLVYALDDFDSPDVVGSIVGKLT